MRQPDLLERTGETEAVEKTESKGDDPGGLARNIGRMRACSGNAPESGGLPFCDTDK
jgi:hypothetical protein